MSDNGFAEPTDTIDGGEGEAQPPTKVPHVRAPISVIKSLEDRPLEQAVKVIEYLGTLDERRRTYLKAASPLALSLIAQNGPEYLAEVQAVSA